MNPDAVLKVFLRTEPQLFELAVSGDSLAMREILSRVMFRVMVLESLQSLSSPGKKAKVATAAREVIEHINAADEKLRAEKPRVVVADASGKVQ